MKTQESRVKHAKKLGRRLSIIGHEQILNFLDNSLLSGRLAHAYIFLGPEDVGKETVARWWLEKVLHQGHEGGERHSLETHPDVTVIERVLDEKTKKQKKLISIEQIRELRERLGLTSFLNTYKVALIRGADHLSIEASNALLKTLEEPLGKAIIVLLVNDISRLPETIVSRCQIIKFKNIPEDLIYDALISRGAKRTEAELLARLAAGSPGVAFKYYEKPELLEEYRDKIASFLKITQAPVWQRFNFVDQVVPKAGDREEIVKEVRQTLLMWQGVLRDAMLVGLGFSNLMINYWANDEIESWQTNRQLTDLVGYLEKTRQALNNLEQNVNIKLIIENLLLCF